MADTDYIWALKTGDLDEVKAKVQTDSNVNRTLDNGRKSLHICADFGQLKVMEFLISKGADVNAVDRHGLTPLMAAIYENHIDCAKLLLEKGAEKKSSDGQTLAECTDNPDMKALLQ